MRGTTGLALPGRGGGGWFSMGGTVRSYLRPAALAVALLLALASAYYFFGPTPDVASLLRPWLPTTGTRLSLPGGVVRQQSSIAVGVGGFLPGETVSLQVRLDDKAKPREFGRVTADGQGSSAGVQVTLPEWLTSGVRKVEAIGQRSGRRAEAALKVRAKGVWVNVNDHSAKQGSKFGLVAGGFEPGESVVATLLPRQGSQGQPYELGKLRADEVGNTAWQEFTMPVLHDDPPLPPGQAKPDYWQQDLSLRGERSGLERKETLTVLRLNQVLELSPWFGPVGAKVEINAQGFLPNEKVRVDLLYAKKTEPALTLRADQYGNLWGAGPVEMPPEVKSGEVQVRLSGEESKNSTQAKFAVTGAKPWAELSTWSGYPGTGIYFNGGGWAAGETVVAHLGSANGPVVAEGTTNNEGFLPPIGPTTVPNVPPAPKAKKSDSRPVVYVLVGEKSSAQASVTFSMQVPFFERQPDPPPPKKADE